MGIVSWLVGGRSIVWADIKERIVAMSDPSLRIYRASAGSGKTFTLVVEFISHLISDFDPSSPAHRHQLAITFTQKATAEMKERILQKLYAIGYGQNDSEAYLCAVKERVTVGLSVRQIRERAARTLRSILHSYDFFHVTTIDSFFQTILTALAHDLGLTSGFRVDLNNNDVLGKGVDKMLRELKPGSEVLEWVTRYVEEQLNDDKSWNVAHPLSALAEELLKEPYMCEAQRLRDLPLNNATVSAYRRKLNRLCQQAQGALQREAGALDRYISDTKGYEVISNGKRWYGDYLNKFITWNFGSARSPVRSTSVTAFINDPCAKLNKKYRGSCEDWITDLGIRFSKFMQQYDKSLFTINSCMLSTRLLNPLRLLEVIDKEVREINKDSNAFMLAHTPILLSRLVGKSEASFVFERVGMQYRHIMIDEFQDTSRLQWENLKHLFVETASQGYSSMIVGDVKQGIYRWRGGDWTALSQFVEDERTHIETLPQNFRSGCNIVAFNNQAFVKLGQLLDADGKDRRHLVTQLYQKELVEQEAHRPGGFVRIHILANKRNEQAESQEVSQSVEREIGEQILRLHQAGVPFDQMAILVRKNKQSQDLLDYFDGDPLLNTIPLVSDEAFMLKSSRAVQVLIHALRFLLHADDDIARAYLKRHCPCEKEEEIFGLLQSWQHNHYTDFPFYELLERLILLFRLEEMEGQAPYLQSFLDAALSYLNDNVPDLKLFLQTWDTTLYKQSIPSSVVAGVRILTMHKSKGLAFHSVFLPYCNWVMEEFKPSDIEWWIPRISPYDEMPILPIPGGDRAEESIYSEDYLQESIARRIENLNVSYVAFTRARQNLIVCCPPLPRSTKKPELGALLAEAITGSAHIWEHMNERVIMEQDEKDLIFELGQPSVLECQPQDKSETSDSEELKNPLEIHPLVEEQQFKLYDRHVAFRQSHNAALYNAALAEGDDTFSNVRDAARREGELLHRMMEHIERREDVDGVVDKFSREGQILDPDMVEPLRQRLHHALHLPTLAAWFDGSWQLYRESSILQRDRDGHLICRRPDRVMVRNGIVVVVDYKFGEQRPEHALQVSSYCRLMREMGYQDVQGYVWYVLEDKVEPVV